LKRRFGEFAEAGRIENLTGGKPAQLDRSSASDKFRLMKVDLRKDVQLGHDLFCSIAFKAASELRAALKIDEGAFR
jgi:hypothetical protein